MKVKDGYINKDFNRNYNKFQKAAIFFGVGEHQYTRTKHLGKKKLKIRDDEIK